MKSMSGMSSKLKQKAVQRFKSLGQTAVVSLLALLLAIGPAAPAFAQGETADQATGSGGLMSTIAVIFNAAGSFARGEYAAGRPIPERDLSSALAALNEFNLAVLKDPRLAGILDEIIAELLEGEGVAAGIQNNTEFIAAVVRDPRLVDTLGEIISDYLQDERLTADFEYLFSVIFELIAEEDLHYYIRDTLAALVEHESLEQTINDLLLTAVNIIYNAGTDAIVALVTDERIPQVIKELASLFIEPVPQIITLLLVDEDNERILQVAEEMLLILAEYGTGLPVNIMEDERLKAALADLILMVYEPVPEAAGAIASDLSEHLFHKTAQGLTADNTLEDALDNFVQDFFKSGLQSYLENSLTTLISQARARAQSATPSDRSLMGQQANIQKSIADGVAKVPPQMVKFGFVRWLVDGNPSPAYSQTPGLDPVPRTYRLWARDVGGLLKENQRAASLAGAAANSIRSILDDYIAENQGHLANLIREAVEGLPLEEAAADIRNNGRLEELSLELVSRIVASLPLEDIAEYIVNDVKLAEVMGEVYEDFVDDLPFAEAGQLIEEDRRLINIVIESLPEISLSEVAEIIRHDDRLLRALADAAAGLPVEKVVEFIQDESRADLIGYIVARTLLNLVADFVADERLALFLHGVLLDAAASLESSPGTLLLDSLARFIENEDSAGYLANSLYELTYGVDYELWNLYKEVVPNFFTRAVWKFI